MIQLHVRYTEAYPDEAPILDISAPQQQSQQQQQQQQQNSAAATDAPPPPPPAANAPSHPHFSVAEDKARLLAVLADAARENLGMAMVFALAATAKEEAEGLIAGRRAVDARAREEVLRAAEREENSKFHGTPVTPESFARWRDAFVREMEEADRARAEEERLAELKKARGSAAAAAARLTGRQLWERGLVGKGDGEGEGDDGDDGDGGLAEGVDKLKVAAA